MYKTKKKNKRFREIIRHQLREGEFGTMTRIKIVYFLISAAAIHSIVVAPINSINWNSVNTRNTALDTTTNYKKLFENKLFREITWTYFWKKKKSFRRRRLGCDFTSLLKRLKSSTKYKPSSHRPTCVGTLDCLHNLIYKKHESLTISVHDLTPIGNIALTKSFLLVNDW